MRVSIFHRVMVRSKLHNARWTSVGTFKTAIRANEVARKFGHMYVRVDLVSRLTK